MKTQQAAPVLSAKDRALAASFAGPAFPLPPSGELRDWSVALSEAKAAQPWTQAQHRKFARRYAGLVGA